MASGGLGEQQGLGSRIGAFRAAKPPAFAALDLGTNNCRLLVARPNPRGHREPFQVVDAFSRIVRLGEGLGREPRLSEAAIQRTIGALKICAEKIGRHRVLQARHVATEACRLAANGREFLARAAAETGIALEIISPAEEARLAVDSCVPLLARDRPYGLMFDIGGGSTELIWLATAERGAPRIIASISLPVGVVRFAERYGGREVGEEAYRAMVAEVRGALAAFEARHAIATAVARGAVQMLGTSGTVTTLAGVHLALRRYDRALVDGLFLDFAAMAEAVAALRRLDYEGRVAHPCVGRERADLVIAGLAILEAICRLWPVGRLRVADRGLREGILLGLMRAHRAGQRAAAPARRPI